MTATGVLGRDEIANFSDAAGTVRMEILVPQFDMEEFVAAVPGEPTSLRVMIRSAAAKPLFSRKPAGLDGRDFAAQVIRKLGSLDALFKNRTTTATTLAGAAHDLAPDFSFEKEEPLSGKPRDSGADKRSVFVTANRAPIFVYEKARLVWMDVSQLQRGEGGDRMYQAVADYARNTGRQFVGDPMGLSEDAMARRTYHMLSNMIRHGDSAGFLPADEQIRGDLDHGIAPLQWPEDNDGQIKALIAAFVETVHHQVPDAYDIVYDFDLRQYANRQTQERVGRESFARAATDARGSGAPSFGGRAIRAAVFLRSLVESEGGRRPGLLEQVLREPAELLKGTGAPLFHRGSDADPIQAEPAVANYLACVARAMKGVARVTVHADHKAFGETNYHEVPDDVAGAYTTDDNTLHFIVSRLPDVRTARAIFLHEGFGHLAMERSPHFAKALAMVGKLRDLGDERTCALWQDIKLRYPDANETTLRKEVIAHIAEDGLSTAVGYRPITSGRAVLRHAVNDTDAEDAQLRCMMAMAARGLPEDALRLLALADIS